MARFPRDEAAIARLAHDVSTGFSAHPDAFPRPPIAPADIRKALSAYEAARAAAADASAKAVLGTAVKDEALENLIDVVKSSIRYAESMCHDDGSNLQLVGWGKRRPRGPGRSEAPGQPVRLRILDEGRTWVSLGWNEPFSGGPISAYRIQRRRCDGGDWIDVGMSIAAEVTLKGQETGVEFEYQVFAANKVGDGPASNVARVVL